MEKTKFLCPKCKKCLIKFNKEYLYCVNKKCSTINDYWDRLIPVSIAKEIYEMRQEMNFKLKKSVAGRITITDNNETFTNGFESIDGKGIELNKFLSKLKENDEIIIGGKKWKK
jgi:hypothetical protein